MPLRQPQPFSGVFFVQANKLTPNKLEQEWRYECLCKFYDKKKDKWVPLDWEER